MSFYIHSKLTYYHNFIAHPPRLSSIHLEIPCTPELLTAPIVSGKDDDELLVPEPSLEHAELVLKTCVICLMYSEEPFHDYEKWNAYVKNHPEKLKRDSHAKDKWTRENELLNLCALRRIRSIVPPSIHCNYTLNMLLDELPHDVARRVWNHKILWFTRMPKNYIAKLHTSDLRYTYRYSDLDELEMRAVWATLPDSFDSDPDGKKTAWKFGLEHALMSGPARIPLLSADDGDIAAVVEAEAVLSLMSRASAYRCV